MKKEYFLIVMVAGVLTVSGCAKIMEPPRMIWGSSTKALEDARGTGVIREFACAFDDCFGDVIAIAKDNFWEIFIQEKQKGTIIVVGIEGSVDTTEVGIFLTSQDEEKAQLEVVSLSPLAQEAASEALFSALEKLLDKAVK